MSSKNQRQVSQQRPSWSTATVASRSQGEQSVTTRSHYYDKQDGSYGRQTSKATHSSGSFGRGGQGYKDEYKLSDSYRVGDSKGYSEYYREERFRTVTYDNTTKTSNKNITYSDYYSDDE